MGAWWTPRADWQPTTLLILTQICVFVKTKLAAPVNVLQGVVQSPKAELVTVGPSFCRLGASAMQEELRLVAEHQLERERRDGNQGRSMQHATNFFRDLMLAPDIGGHGVHRSAHPRILE